MSILKKIEKDHEKNWIDDHEYDPNFKSKLTDAEIKETLDELVEEKKKQGKK